MIRDYEKQYIKIVKDIMENGYYDNNRTGIPTYKIPHQIIQVDLEKEFPILTSKLVAFKTAIKELLWIYNGDNDVGHLQEQNVHIWDEWMMEDGTIGTSYGWIVKNYKQLDRVIEQLKTNPQDRRIMINLWQWDYLDTGALAPCCFETMFDVTDGKLNCMLVVRSNDIPLGNPFNTTQYAVLTHLLAQVTGLKVGKLTHIINNAHIYENQLEGMKEQLERYELMQLVDSYRYDLRGNKRSSQEIVDYIEIQNKGLKLEDVKKYLEAIECEPKLILNPSISDFYGFKIEDIQLEGYKHLGAIKMPVAV